MEPIALEQVPQALRKFVDPAAPVAMRTMAAKGLVPIPPKDLVFVQCVLAGASDEAIATAADKSLRAHPSNILKPIVGAPLPAFVLDQLADRLLDKAELLEPFALNRDVSDDTLARIVPQLPEPIVSLLLQNEERTGRSRALVVALKDHPQASRALVDRMFDLLVRDGVILDGVSEFADAILRLSNDERLEAVANIEVPQDLLDPTFLPPPSEDAVELDAVAAEPDDANETPDAEVPNEPLLKRIGSMTMAQKVAIAMKGNKEVRTALLRDSNKVVAVAAIKNPRITEQEVATVAASKTANEEVIRIVSNTKEWTKSYAVKLALTTNPKTPLPVAMRFLALLNQNDLKNVAKSKNLPSALVNQAKAMMSRTK